jgi:hypothetical protein
MSKDNMAMLTPKFPNEANLKRVFLEFFFFMFFAKYLS